MRLPLGLAFAALLAAAPAPAQTWQPVGPPGGDVRSLAADPRNPSRIYLGTADGILYRSDDAGRKWIRLTPGFPRRGQSLDELLVDPRGRLLVGYWDVHGQGGGVAISTDAGVTFREAADIAGESVRALTLSESDPAVLAAGTLSGVFRSEDGGLHWRRMSPEGHPELRNVESVAFDPRTPKIVYVGTWHLPWKTVDGGETWKAIHAGMIDDSDVFTLNVDRRDPAKVFATACSGIYRSADGAARWSRIRGIPSSSRRTRAFAQDRVNVTTFYAGTTEGLWVSEDDAATWKQVTPPNLVVNAVVPLPDGTLLLGTEGAGVLRSEDGKAFVTSNHGFSERFVSRIVFERESKRVLLGIWGDRQWGGVIAAPTPRGPWSRLARGLEGREVLSLAAAHGVVLAGTDDGVFSLSPLGDTWLRLETRVGGVEARPRVIDVAALSSDVYLAATSTGILRTVDGGRTWHAPAVAAGSFNALAPSASARGFVLGAASLGLYASADFGETWTRVSDGLGAPIQALAVSPVDPKIAFATTRIGIYRSADFGRRWVRCRGNLPDSDLTGLAVHPDGRTLYVSDFTWGGVYQSLDAGDTWAKLPSAGLGSERVWTVGVDPSSPHNVLAASPAGGLHIFNPPPPELAAGSQ